MKKSLLGGAIASIVLLSSTAAFADRGVSAGLGDVDTLLTAYERFEADYEVVTGENRSRLTLGLVSEAGISTQDSDGSGQTSIDLETGAVSARVHGLEGPGFSLWLVDNKPRGKRSMRPNRRDRMVEVGTFVEENGVLILEANLADGALDNFDVDQAVVTRAGETPADEALLVGLPSLFQQIYHGYAHDFNLEPKRSNSRRHEPWRYGFNITAEEAARYNEGVGDRPDFAPYPFAALAGHRGGDESSARDALQSLVNFGERVFLNETFDGNGRTCGTCHSPTEDYTVTPTSIDELPDHDPMFVAEFNSELAELEDPELLRRFALFRENLDGFDKPAVLRSSAHLMGLNTSLASTRQVQLDANGEPILDANGNLIVIEVSTGERVDEFALDNLGWSGDGSPGTGVLRNFAAGAISQHLPQTPNRIEGQDFRLPTNLESLAMEAFQLSLGRPADIDIGELVLLDESVARGRDNFVEPIRFRCNNCHGNGGANRVVNGPDGSFILNANRNTKVEKLLNIAPRLVKDFPIDGGFGTDPDGGRTDIPNADGSFGDGSFSIIQVIESADTGPFFHNNAVATIEEAVAFYNSAAFNEGRPAGTEIVMEPDEVQSIANFLRVVNSLENIRDVVTMEERLLDNARLRDRSRNNRRNIRNLFAVAKSNTDDAIRVLKEAHLHLEATDLLEESRELLDEAQGRNDRVRANKVRRAMEKQMAARDLMCEARPGTVICE